MKTKISPAGNGHTEQGFTLFELLVVITIIGLLVAAVPGFLLRDNHALELDRATRAMAAGLREVRTDAIFENADRRFAVDVENAQFRAGDKATPVQLQSGVSLDLMTSRREQSGPSIGGIRFHPDGSSSGGQVVLTLGEQRRLIRVDWLTGIVSVSDDLP